jgi:hypothetical protein
VSLRFDELSVLLASDFISAEVEAVNGLVFAARFCVEGTKHVSCRRVNREERLDILFADT